MWLEIEEITAGSVTLTVLSFAVYFTYLKWKGRKNNNVNVG